MPSSLTKKKRSSETDSPSSRSTSRQIPPAVRERLWGIAAGRCEFEGCNRPVWKNNHTQDVGTFGEKAHIKAFSPEGPRGHDGSDVKDINDVDNLMLLCQAHHTAVDTGDGPTKYSVDGLRAMKTAHEARIFAACNVTSDRVSQVITYATHVGAHQALPTMPDASASLLGLRRYPASKVIDLGTPDGADTRVDREFWLSEVNRLSKQFDRQIRQPLEDGDIGHLSVFALAPQPLLMLLGTLIGDICPADVYQRRREPATWDWNTDATHHVDFVIREPNEIANQVALVFSISASVDHERIRRVLGNDVAIWTVTVATPHNDLIQTTESVKRFRESMRPLLDRIKVVHGHGAELHVFPAMPVSLAVEFGRLRMPKADMRLKIYDEQHNRGGFVHALTIKHGA